MELTMNVFQAVDQLESQDDIQAKKRRKILSKDVARSKATNAQTTLTSKLIECRILLHRALKEGEDEGEQDHSEEIETCNRILIKLLEARSQIVRKEESEIDYEALVKQDDNLEEILNNEFSERQEVWKKVLDKRHKDAKLHSGQTTAKSFRVMDASFWDQVENTVQFEQSREYDDSKLYQHLLKDFITSKVTSQDGQVVRTKAQNKKKKVDRRASKGRKIRYTTVPKLVNFTFPLSRPQAELETDTYFRSMFGGVAK